MYIPDFWVGVGTTLLCEFIVISLIVFISVKGKKDENDNDQSNE